MKKLCVFLLLFLLVPAAVQANEAEEIRTGHREAARWLIDSFNEGVKLSGSVEQNGSEGIFDVYFYGEEFLLKKTFGDLEYYVYIDNDTIWDDTNFSLPFMLEPEDHPADMVLNMISSGAYLDDPNWEYFKYIDEDAGGYNCVFAPPGLPVVKIVLYSDPEEDNYLQLMSTEVALSANDPTSMTYRSYFYYEVDEADRILINRETGRSIDQNGEAVDFSELVVDSVELLDEHPAELVFDTARVPPSEVKDALQGPVEIPVDTGQGYFIIPVTFAGSDETFAFLFDTGAAVSLFIPEAAEAAKLESSLTVTGHGHGGHTNLDVGICRTASLGAADAEQLVPLAGFPVTTIDENNESLLNLMYNYGIGGIMGISMLHQYVAAFDHAEQKITIYPQSLFKAEEVIDPRHIVLPLDVEDLIQCDGSINGELAGEAVIDTGLQMDLALLGETLEQAGLELQEIDQGTMTVLNGIRSFSLVNVPSFELGPLVLTDKMASITDDDRGTLSARGLLGYIGVTLFHDKLITLDLFNQLMYIEDPHDTGIFAGIDFPSDDNTVEDDQAVEVEGLEQDAGDPESDNDTTAEDQPQAQNE